MGKCVTHFKNDTFPCGSRGPERPIVGHNSDTDLGLKKEENLMIRDFHPR